MRTTLTLEPDVAALLQRIRSERRRGLKEIINQALRVGLLEMDSARASSKPYRTSGRDLGKCLVASLDDVAEALTVAEAEDYK